MITETPDDDVTAMALKGHLKHSPVTPMMFLSVKVVNISMCDLGIVQHIRDHFTLKQRYQFIQITP